MFRWIFHVNLVMIPVAATGLWFSIHGLGQAPVNVPVVTAIVLAILILFHFGVVMGLNDVLRHASVIPYFPRRVGDIETFGEGEALARHVVELDVIAVSLGLTTLSAFGWNDDLDGEPLVWHHSADGLRTVLGLLDQLDPTCTFWDDLDGVAADLKRLAHALERASGKDIPFSLPLEALDGHECSGMADPKRDMFLRRDLNPRGLSVGRFPG